MFWRRRSSVAEHIVDDVLGRLTFSAETGNLVSEPKNGIAIEIGVDAKGNLDRRALERAHALWRNLDVFVRSLRQWLGSHTAGELGSRVVSLKPNLVSLHGDEGMVFFDDMGDDRVWRCDFVGFDEFTHLSYDQ